MMMNDSENKILSKAIDSYEDTSQLIEQYHRAIDRMMSRMSKKLYRVYTTLLYVL
jgi:hypothetical protein